MVDNKSEQVRHRLFISVAVSLSIVWMVLSWFGASAYVDRETERAVSVTSVRARGSAEELGAAVQGLFTVMHVVPRLVANNPKVRHALLSAKTHPLPAYPPGKNRQAERARSPDLRKMDREVAEEVKAAGAIAFVWVMQPDGVSIIDTNGSTIGVRFADRSYFRSAMAGTPDIQYAMGRTTRTAGLYFPAPVFWGRDIIGVVAAKLNIVQLSNWVSRTNGFVVDRYGVILYSADSKYEMMVLPDATVNQLSDAERMDRYSRLTFKTLDIRPYDAHGSAEITSHVKLIGDTPTPYFVETYTLKDGVLRLITATESPELGAVWVRKKIFFAAASVGGIPLIILGVALAYHLMALQLMRKSRIRDELIAHLASHDALTGLYSRALTDQLISQSIAIAQRDGRKCAIMLMDLDLFKDINDSFGHEIGDNVLRELAVRIKSVVRKTDIVIRHGGDEFIVVLNDVKDPVDVALVASNLQHAVQQPFLIQNVSMVLSVSIGIALHPSDGDNASLLLRHADTAMYFVKGKGRADYSFYQVQMSVDLLARKTLEAEMARGVENGEFFLQYQPQYSLEEGRIIGCEALIRWNHPTRGVVPPMSFIPVAERAGFIGVLGDWVLNEACRQAMLWREALGTDISVAVNLSGVQFQHTDLLESIERAMQTSGIPPHMLELEITETVMMSDTKYTCQLIQRMKLLGIRISIDDFGTGYSSLAYLKKFDVDVLKIDRSFVGEMEKDPNDLAIVSAVINMARSLDYKVIAEGVENRAQYDALSDLRCHIIQGYWFSRPLSADDFAAFFIRHRESQKESSL
ncbi:MAG: EAL domain-containing protein [Burkholderiaceae bacterium]|nr:EAL domain-containing protein [Burkholderiaceae bacterium]